MLVHLPRGGIFDSQLLPATRTSLAVVARLFEQYLGVGEEGAIDLVEGGIVATGVISAQLENGDLVVKKARTASCWSVFIKINSEIVFNRPFDEIRDRVELHDTLVRVVLRRNPIARSRRVGKGKTTMASRETHDRKGAMRRVELAPSTNAVAWCA